MLALFIAFSLTMASAAANNNDHSEMIGISPASLQHEEISETQPESTEKPAFKLPSSLQFIDDDAFEGTAFSSLTEKLTGNSDVKDHASPQISVSDARLEAVFRLPAYLEFIAEEAFAGTAAEAVVLPETVTEIGDRAFAEMPRLVAINIPDSVFEIGHDAFDVPRQVMVFGSTNGPAGRYAAEKGMPFMPTDAALPEAPRQVIAERRMQETPTAIDLISEERDDATVEETHQKYKPIIIARCIDRPELNHQTRLFP